MSVEKVSPLISKQEAEYLINLPKKQENPKDSFKYPTFGGKISIPLISTETKDAFLLDIRTKKVVLYSTQQLRAKKSIVLMRLDFGVEHTNPDGTKVGSPHLHIFTEEYGDKWAIPVSDLPDDFDSLSGKQIFDYFCSKCNIVEQLNINWDLFSS